MKRYLLRINSSKCDFNEEHQQFFESRKKYRKFVSKFATVNEKVGNYGKFYFIIMGVHNTENGERLSRSTYVYI